MAYNAQTDYEKLIRQAAGQKNYAQAAAYEQARNEKIAGEGLNYEQTNRYLNYLNGTPTSGISTAPLSQISVPAYSSPYASGIQSAIAELQGSKWEGWDKDSDPSWQAYKKEYLREADRTQEETLGQYAVMTGGMPSSAAINAASQAGDYFKAQLTDKIPELYQNAYQRYLGYLQNKQNLLSQQISAENANINQFYQQAAAERLAAAQNESQYYNQINAAMSKWSALGYADADVANILGVGLGTTTSDQAYRNWDQAFQERQYQDKLDEAAAKAADKGAKGGPEEIGDQRKDELTKMASDYYFAHRNAATNDLTGQIDYTSYNGLTPGSNLMGSYTQNKLGLNSADADYFNKQLQGYIDKYGTYGKVRK